MSEPIKFRYQTLTGEQRKVEFEPIPGSSHWNRTGYKLVGDDWKVTASAEVKYVREIQE